MALKGTYGHPRFLDPQSMLDEPPPARRVKATRHLPGLSVFDSMHEPPPPRLGNTRTGQGGAT